MTVKFKDKRKCFIFHFKEKRCLLKGLKKEPPVKALILLFGIFCDWHSYDFIRMGKESNGKRWTLKYSKKYWKNKGNKYKYHKARQLSNAAMTGWHRQLCPRKLQGQQNLSPLFKRRSLTSPPTLTSWNSFHKTGSKGHFTLSKKRHNFSLCPWPHPYTQPSAMPALARWICLTAETRHAALARPRIRSHVHT